MRSVNNFNDPFTRSYFIEGLSTISPALSKAELMRRVRRQIVVQNYFLHPIADELFDRTVKECAAFQDEFQADVAIDPSGAGRAFWQVRSTRGGPGFSNGVWSDVAAARLKEGAQKFPTNQSLLVLRGEISAMTLDLTDLGL